MLGRVRNERISHMTSDKYKKYVIRSLRKCETNLLKDFLYEAIFIPKGAEPPARDIIEKPELRVYTDDFGIRKGDNCLVADFGGKAIGAIELKLNGHTDMTDRDDECEMGYWLGKPFWGQGIMPEAVMEMLRHAFEDCGMQKVWIGYYEGNNKSKRVQEKCGFMYQWRSEDVDVPLMHEKRTGHVSLMTKEDWMAER